MQRVSLLTLVGAALGLSASANAQVCGGFASFAAAPYQVSGSGLFNDNSKSFVGGFAFGGAGPFGGLSLGTTSYDEIDGSSFLYGASGGYQVVLGEQKNIHLCPTAGLGIASGPNNQDVFGDGSVILDLSETDFSFGLGLGVLASRSNQTQIIPNVSLAFVSATLKASDDVSGLSDSNTETFGLLGLGLGFVFNQTVTLHPSVAIPFGLENASTTFGATVSLNFGGKAH